jgi:hypothetical protein
MMCNAVHSTDPSVQPLRGDSPSTVCPTPAYERAPDSHLHNLDHARHHGLHGRRPAACVRSRNDYDRAEHDGTEEWHPRAGVRSRVSRSCP